MIQAVHCHHGTMMVRALISDNTMLLIGFVLIPDQWYIYNCCDVHWDLSEARPVIIGACRKLAYCAALNASQAE
jgi:hypothetical protein